MDNEEQFTQLKETYIQNVQHLAAHIDGTEFTDECPTAIVISHTTPEMIRAFINSLNEDDLDELCIELNVDEESNAEENLKHYLSTKEGCDALTELFENEEYKYFLDHENNIVLNTCDIGDVIDDEIQSISYRLDPEGDDHHICLALTTGGPSVFIVRDFDGDYLDISYGQSDKVYLSEATDILDYLSQSYIRKEKD